MPYKQKSNNIMQQLVILTGAGISAESGLSTFRDTDGLWQQYDVMELASIQGYRRNRERVLEFYNARRSNLLTVRPNHAHEVLAELERDYQVTIITQNVDDLHERAGSTHVLHLHGELTKVTSSMNPNDPKCVVERVFWRECAQHESCRPDCTASRHLCCHRHVAGGLSCGHTAAPCAQGHSLLSD